MKIDWTQQLHDINGNVIPETHLVDGRVVKKRDNNGNIIPLTLGRACINALLTDIEGELQTGAQKFDRAQLAYDIGQGKEPTAENITLIKERVGKVYTTYATWLIWRILEGQGEENKE